MTSRGMVMTYARAKLIVWNPDAYSNATVREAAIFILGTLKPARRTSLFSSTPGRRDEREDWVQAIFVLTVVWQLAKFGHYHFTALKTDLAEMSDSDIDAFLEKILRQIEKGA